MKRAKYRGDVRAEFRVGQILGRLNDGAYVRVTHIDYDPAADRTIVTAEHGAPVAPDGMRLRYHGQAGDQ